MCMYVSLVERKKTLTSADFQRIVAYMLTHFKWNIENFAYWSNLYFFLFYTMCVWCNCAFSSIFFGEMLKICNDMLSHEFIHSIVHLSETRRSYTQMLTFFLQSCSYITVLFCPFLLISIFIFLCQFNRVSFVTIISNLDLKYYIDITLDIVFKHFLVLFNIAIPIGFLKYFYYLFFVVQNREILPNCVR